MSFLTLPASAVAGWLDDLLTDVEAVAPDLSSDVGALRHRSAEPPRILIAGGRQTGKTTLVQALTGGDVRRTAAPTLYCSADRSVPDGLPTEMQVHQVTGAPLQNLSLIDGGAEPPDPGVADAALYLVDREPAPGDLTRITDLGFGSPGTGLVLSRADEFGVGSLGSADSVTDARTYARTLSDNSSGASGSSLWATVTAVSPLLAAAAHAVDDELAGYLCALPDAGLAPTLLHDNPPPELSNALSVIGTYGVLHGRQHSVSGSSGLSTWLTESSRLADLKAVLLGSLSQAALLHRAAGILDDLGQLRFRARPPGEVASVLDRAAATPIGWRARLFPSVGALEAAGLEDDAALVAEMISADGPQDLAGVAAGATDVDVANGLRDRLRAVNLRLTGFTVPVAEAALTTLSVVLRGAVRDAEKALSGDAQGFNDQLREGPWR